MCMKPKRLLFFILFILVLILLFNYNTSFAYYTGDDTYTDNNNTINIAYSSIGNDLMFRLDKLSNDSNYVNLMSFLKSVNYGYYCYYGSSDGLSLINGSTYNQQDLWVAVYDLSNPYMTFDSNYTSYQGMECNIYINRGVLYCYRLSDDGIAMFTGISVYMPGILYNYKLDNVTNYLLDGSDSQTNSVVNAINQQTQATQEQTNSINQQTNTIEQQTGVIQETQNYIKDDNVDTNTLVVDTSGLSPSDNEGVEGFFTSLLSQVGNIFNSIDDSTVDIINFPLPGNGNIELRSDMISRYVKNTSVYTYIQVFWWAYIGIYIVLFAKRMLEWLSTGEIAEKGVSSFIRWLDKNNEIINSSMM